MLSLDIGNRGKTIVSVSAAVTTAWRYEYDSVLRAAEIVVDYHSDGDALAQVLATDWKPRELIVLDLALATPGLAMRLDRNGPRLLAFGSPDHAGMALAANLAGFLDPAPTPADLIAAVEAAVAPVPVAGVADLSDRSVARLGLLGAEASRISDALARLGKPLGDTVAAIDAAQLRALIRARRARDRFFAADLFGEPAWDMLLDLGVAHGERRDVAVSSLCIAAAVPTTTALRWIKTLCDAGLFERHDDPRDARRAFISLSSDAAAALARYLAAA